MKEKNDITKGACYGPRIFLAHRVELSFFVGKGLEAICSDSRYCIFQEFLQDKTYCSYKN